MVSLQRRKVLRIAAVMTALATMGVRTKNVHANQDIDLTAWQRAKINWQQFSGTELSILGDAQPSFMALQPYFPIFEKLTGIKVNFLPEEQEQMRAKKHLDLSSRSGIYDVIPMGITELGDPYEKGWIEKLAPYLGETAITDPEWFKLDDFTENSLVLCKAKGDIVSIPFDFSAPIFFYRKDLFEKYHIAVPDTYDDLIIMKRQLQKAIDSDSTVKGMYAFTTRTGIGAGINTWMIIPVIRAFGGDMLDATYHPIFNSPQAVAALKTYKEMVTGYGSPPDSLTMHFYEHRELFRNGKLASFIDASHLFSEMDSPQKTPLWDKWDAAPMPRGPVGRHTSPWAWGFSINSSSAYKKPAWLFVQWATSQPTARLLTTGGAPARRSVWGEQSIHRQNTPGLIRAINWIMQEGSNSSLQMGLPEFPEAGLIASRAFSEICYGADAKATLDRAVADVEKVMLHGPSRKLLKK